jgi:hypothetical protein
MEQAPQSAAAAPPDDGGHSGSFATPHAELELHAADRPPQAPALHGDRERANGASDGSSPAALVVAGLIFIAITAFFVFVRL